MRPRSYNAPISLNVGCPNGGPIIAGPNRGPIVAGPNGGPISNGSPARGGPPPSTPAQIKAQAIQIADQDYADYSRFFLSPSTSLMIKTGLWLELEAIEIILTPIFSRANIPHFINLQRAVVGLATAHLEPAGLSARVFGGDGPSATAASILVPETTLVPCASSSPGSSAGPSSAPGG